MEVIGKKDKTHICPECEGKMYLLPGSQTSIYVCRDCGCSADVNSYDIQNGEIKNRLAEESQNESLQKGKNCIKSIFPIGFMKKYTEYENIVDFLKAGNILSENIKDIDFNIFKKIRGRKLDQYINKNTVFKSWDEMFERASGRFLKM